MIKHCGGPAVVRRWSGGGASVVQCADGCRWCTDGGPAVVRWWVQVVVRWVQVVVRWSLRKSEYTHKSGEIMTIAAEEQNMTEFKSRQQIDH
ncbi:hypothetical protein LXL04_031868 [Taraxacum kok-saghyz]